MTSTVEALANGRARMKACVRVSKGTAPCGMSIVKMAHFSGYVLEDHAQALAANPAAKRMDDNGDHTVFYLDDIALSDTCTAPLAPSVPPPHPFLTFSCFYRGGFSSQAFSFLLRS